MIMVKSSIIKFGIYSLLNNPSMIGSIFSGNFDEMYCKYWKNKLKESSKYENNFSGNEKKNIMDGIVETNRQILNKKNSTIEAFYIPLYWLIRKTNPDIIVETGVHRGVSSLFILQALHENNKGKLFSIDLPQAKYEQDNNDYTKSVLPTDKIGICIYPELKKRWTLILDNSKKELPKLLERLSSIDIFLHDSQHTYKHMKWEYETAWPYIKNNGMLLSDDTNWSMGAFDEFAKKNGSYNIQLRRDGRSQETFGMITK